MNSAVAAGDRPGADTAGDPGRRGWRAALLLFFLVLGIRFVYVALFAESTPYWDQWDSEADLLLRPWADGTWRFGDLFNLHNEHRIAFSRLLAIAIFEANDRQWDNLVEAYASAAIFAAMFALLYVLLRRGVTSRVGPAVLFVTIAVLAALPFEWENFLVGFQNSFYFMSIFAIAAIALVSFRRPSRSTLLLELGVGIAGLFTLASGLLAAPAAMAVVVMRNWRDRLRPEVLLAYGAVFAFIFVLGMSLVPDVPHHRVLRAAGAVEHLNAFAVALMWPVQEGTKHWSLAVRAAFAVLVWLPALSWGLRFVRTRSATAPDLFAGGMAIWAAIQALAMAHSRGHEMSEVTSRYMGLLALGLPINVYFALRLIAQVRAPIALSRWMRGAMAAFFIVVAVALIARTPEDMHYLSERLGYMRIQAENTRAYVATRDFRHLQQPFLHIPYPDAERLRSLLDNPTIHAMLPSSIRAPLPLSTPAQGYSADGMPRSLPVPEGRAALGSYGGSGASLTYRSSLLHTSFPYLSFLTSGGSGGSLKLVGDEASAGTAVSVPMRGEAIGAWSGSIVASPGAVFHIEAADAGAGRRMAFTAPLEIGRLSRWALRLQSLGRRVAVRIDPSFGVVGHAAENP